MKVKFLVVGTQKGGTTALHHFLNQHPGLCLPKVKEAHYFDTEEFFAGAPDYGCYHAHFAHGQAGQVWGEVTPIYMYWKPAAERIWRYNPDMKLIFCLRNPADRAYSHYMMEQQRGNEQRGFSYAIRLGRLRCLKEYSLQHRIYSYVERGYYSRQINRLLSFFPRENMLFLKNEDLFHRHDATLTKIWDFIGVSPPPLPIKREKIFSADYTPMLESDRSFLLWLFHAEISRIEKLLGWDLQEWLS